MASHLSRPSFIFYVTQIITILQFKKNAINPGNMISFVDVVRVIGAFYYV